LILFYFFRNDEGNFAHKDAHKLVVVKYFLMVAGTVLIIYGFMKDADPVIFIGVATFMIAFFLRQIINELKS
jgi:hypothetical protein